MTARSATTVQPRLLERRQAAAYCSLSEAAFSEWVRDKRVPGPLPGTKRWDRRALDACLDRLSGIAHDHVSIDADAALDAWLERQNS